MYDLGDPIVLSVNVYNSADVLADATSVSLVLTGQAAYVFDPITSSPTGVYTKDVGNSGLPPGHYAVRWVGVGNNYAANTDVFDIEPALSPALVSLARTKGHENFLNNVDDEELRTFINAASTWAEREYGPLGRQTFVETRTPSGNQVALSHWSPGQTVTLVSVVGAWGYTATLDITTLHVTDAGILEPNYGGWLGCYPLTITYQAGSSILTEDVQIGVLEVVAGLWETQHGGGTSGGGPEALLQASGEGEFVANMGLRYWRADMLLKSHRAPVVA